jgi:hypothetical protein
MLHMKMTPKTLEYLLQWKILYKLELLGSYRWTINITVVKTMKSVRPEI